MCVRARACRLKEKKVKQTRHHSLKKRYWSYRHADDNDEEDFSFFVVVRGVDFHTKVFSIVFFDNVGTAPVNISQAWCLDGNWNTLGVPLSKGINKPG